jgi:hypothetical protein
MDATGSVLWISIRIFLGWSKPEINIPDPGSDLAFSTKKNFIQYRTYNLGSSTTESSHSTQSVAVTLKKCQFLPGQLSLGFTIFTA